MGKRTPNPNRHQEGHRGTYSADGMQVVTEQAVRLRLAGLTVPKQPSHLQIVNTAMIDEGLARWTASRHAFAAHIQAWGPTLAPLQVDRPGSDAHIQHMINTAICKVFMESNLTDGGGGGSVEQVAAPVQAVAGPTQCAPILIGQPCAPVWVGQQQLPAAAQQPRQHMPATAQQPQQHMPATAQQPRQHMPATAQQQQQHMPGTAQQQLPAPWTGQQHLAPVVQLEPLPVKQQQQQLQLVPASAYQQQRPSMAQQQLLPTWVDPQQMPVMSKLLPPMAQQQRQQQQQQQLLLTWVDQQQLPVMQQQQQLLGQQQQQQLVPAALYQQQLSPVAQQQLLPTWVDPQQMPVMTELLPAMAQQQRRRQQQQQLQPTWVDQQQLPAMAQWQRPAPAPLQHLPAPVPQQHLSASAAQQHPPAVVPQQDLPDPAEHPPLQAQHQQQQQHHHQQQQQQRALVYQRNLLAWAHQQQTPLAASAAPAAPAAPATPAAPAANCAAQQPPLPAPVAPALPPASPCTVGNMHPTARTPQPAAASAPPAPPATQTIHGSPPAAAASAPKAVPAAHSPDSSQTAGAYGGGVAYSWVDSHWAGERPQRQAGPAPPRGCRLPLRPHAASAAPSDPVRSNNRDPRLRFSPTPSSASPTATIPRGSPSPTAPSPNATLLWRGMQAEDEGGEGRRTGRERSRSPVREARSSPRTVACPSPDHSSMTVGPPSPTASRDAFCCDSLQMITVPPAPGGALCGGGGPQVARAAGPPRSQWQVCHTAEGQPYYYNATTGALQKEAPACM